MDTSAPSELRILLVDDHDDTLCILKRLLRLEGHFVKATTASRYALDLARAESFHIVMSDIGLPEMSGTALLAQLRRIRPIKAIALTGYGMPEEVEQIKAAGFDEVLIKPISFDILIRSIDNVIRSGIEPMSMDGDGHYTPDPKLLLMKLYNYEKTLAMLGSEIERRKVEAQICLIRGRLKELGNLEEY